VLLAHRDTSAAAVLRRTALADRITGASRSVEPHRQSHHRFVTASSIGRQQHTHVVPPCLRPFLVRPPISQHDPGLAASPPVCYYAHRAGPSAATAPKRCWPCVSGPCTPSRRGGTGRRGCALSWPAAVTGAVTGYIAWYNGTPLHSAPGYRAPAEYEAAARQNGPVAVA
jgi:hypothetical protein